MTIFWSTLQILLLSSLCTGLDVFMISSRKEPHTGGAVKSQQNRVNGTTASGVPEVSICMLDETDRLPNHLAMVLEFPKKYIQGPNSELVGPKKHITIVGAGISGLISAYLLLSVGHKVTMLEASNRIGGRIYTRYENGYYGDIGAMRFPQHHVVLMKALKLFNVKTETFTNHHQGFSGNYFFLNGKYFLEKDLEKQSKLRELYRSYGIFNPPRDGNGTILNPLNAISSLFEEDIENVGHCNDDQSFAAYLKERCEKAGIDPKVILVWAEMTTDKSFISYTMHDFIQDSDEQYYLKQADGLPYLEIVNGSSKLVDAVFSTLQAFPEFTIHKNARVFRINNRKPKMKVFYRIKEGSAPERKEHVITDKIIIGTTAKAVTLIDFMKPLPPWKQIALNSINYMNAFKIFIKFKTPFWSKRENNWAEPILYGRHKGKTSGSVGVTNHHLVQIYYPSHDYHGPSLLASYTWNNDADFFLSLSEKETIELVLKELSDIHGPVVREEYEEAFMYNWLTDRYSHGAFVAPVPGQDAIYKAALIRPVGNIHFVGEYNNKWYMGWVEAALESAVRALVNDAPEAYDRQFKKDDIEFLSREGRMLKK